MPTDRAVWFFAIVILTLVGLAWGLIDTRRVIEAPFLYAMGMALILCPQLYVVAANPSRVPDEAFWVFSTMVVLCTAALYFGYFSKPKQRYRSSRPVQTRRINHVRLYKIGFSAAAVGAFGAYKLSTLGTITEWRGWPVYWLNILAFVVPGIALMLISYVEAPTARRLIPIIFFSFIPLLWITDAGRRSATLTFPLTLMLPFLLHKRTFRIPRVAILGALVFAFIVVYAFPVWRGQFKDHSYSQAVQDNPLSGIIEETFGGGDKKPLEIADGMIVAGARYQLGNYEWGVVALYNSIIESYVPGSIIGQDLKDSLRIGVGRDQSWSDGAYGIKVANNTAKSGYTDLFSQFSFLGCIVMYWIGKGFRRAHDAAVYKRDGRAVIFLCFFLSLPASVAYGAVIYGLVVQLPAAALMLIACHWCVGGRSIHQGLVRGWAAVPSAATNQFPVGHRG
jgi:hypothetical protein